MTTAKDIRVVRTNFMMKCIMNHIFTDYIELFSRD